MATCPWVLPCVPGQGYVSLGRATRPWDCNDHVSGHGEGYNNIPGVGTDAPGMSPPGGLQAGHCIQATTVMEGLCWSVTWQVKAPGLLILTHCCDQPRRSPGEGVRTPQPHQGWGGRGQWCSPGHPVWPFPAEPCGRAEAGGWTGPGVRRCRVPSPWACSRSHQRRICSITPRPCHKLFCCAEADELRAGNSCHRGFTLPRPFPPRTARSSHTRSPWRPMSEGNPSPSLHGSMGLLSGTLPGHPPWQTTLSGSHSSSPCGASPSITHNGVRLRVPCTWWPAAPWPPAPSADPLSSSPSPAAASASPRSPGCGHPG